MINNLPYAQREAVKKLIFHGYKFIGMASNEAVMSNGVRVDYKGFEWSNHKINI